jgi:transposase
MDKASARQALGEHRIKQAMVPVIPAKSKRIISLDSDKSLYKVREKVERGFNNLKQWRRIARRYAKLSQTFLAWVHLVAVWMIIK